MENTGLETIKAQAEKALDDWAPWVRLRGQYEQQLRAYLEKTGTLYTRNEVTGAYNLTGTGISVRFLERKVKIYANVYDEDYGYNIAHNKPVNGRNYAKRQDAKLEHFLLLSELVLAAREMQFWRETPEFNVPEVVCAIQAGGRLFMTPNVPHHRRSNYTHIAMFYQVVPLNPEHPEARPRTLHLLSDGGVEKRFGSDLYANEFKRPAWLRKRYEICRDCEKPDQPAENQLWRDYAIDFIVPSPNKRAVTYVANQRRRMDSVDCALLRKHGMDAPDEETSIVEYLLYVERE